MDAQQFAYWLQGFAELNGDISPPNEEQWGIIRCHLAAVFVKVTTSREGVIYPKEMLPSRWTPVIPDPLKATC